MRQSRTAILCYSFLAFTLVGCGESQPAATSTLGTANTATDDGTLAGPAALQDQVAPNDPIAALVFEFFNAVRARDENAAKGLLTPKAVQRMAELQMDFNLPVSNAATFQVSASELLESDIAYVDTTWNEADADGQMQQDQLTVLLKLDGGRWFVKAVVSGLGTQFQDGIVFEEPDQPFSNALLSRNMDPASVATPQQAALPQVDAAVRQ